LPITANRGDGTVRKELLASPVVKDRLLKSCIYLNRRQNMVKTLDVGEGAGDSERIFDDRKRFTAKGREGTRPMLLNDSCSLCPRIDAIL
jgi:hypothetical protein